MHSARQRLIACLLGPVTLGSLAACSVHHDEYVATGSPPPPPMTIPEVEVNDFAWAPQTIGWVQGGQTIYIEGSITDQGWDPRDGFQLFAETPLIVDVSLDAHVPGVDLDWCVWDPVVGDYTVCAETEFNPELGSFAVVPPGNEFHLVVSSYSGTSTYTMTVQFSTYFPATLDAPELGTAESSEAPELVEPRNERFEDYPLDRTWMEPEVEGPLFSGPLFELEASQALDGQLILLPVDQAD